MLYQQLKKTKPKPKPLSTDRNTIIPGDFIVNISDPRINKIYYELRSLVIDNVGKEGGMTYENSGAVIFRVFVEFSVEAYLKANNIDTIHPNESKLRKKVETVANYMEEEGILGDQPLKRIRSAVSNEHDILSINNFNAYVHNNKYSPTPKELKLVWDDIQEFIKVIWESVK